MELRIEGLSKTYPNGVQALKNVSLSIPTGMFGLVGPNGAGKSTLMRTIATLQEADTGSIQLESLDVLRNKDGVRRILGYLPQEFGVYPEIEAEEMLNHYAVLKGMHNSRERKAHVLAILNQTNLYQVRKTKLKEFSGGTKQRFGIAQALLGHPQLIIVDEPTAGLDPEERSRFLNLLSEIGENVIVILSTHIVDDVRVLCSRMAIIHEGVLLMADEPANAMGRLKGKVWKKIIAKAELPEYQSKHHVLSNNLFAGKMLIRVLDASQPDASFEPAEPDLEDVYFAAVKNNGN